MNGPLEGIKVIECGHWLVAPIASSMLGDLGADVIKIEPRGHGDPMRGLTHVSGQK
jgi:formyl-CoA transferase